MVMTFHSFLVGVAVCFAAVAAVLFAVTDIVLLRIIVKSVCCAIRGSSGNEDYPYISRLSCLQDAAITTVVFLGMLLMCCILTFITYDLGVTAYGLVFPANY